MKILIAGLGSIGQRHARNLRAMFGDHVELLAWRVRGRPGIISDAMTLDCTAAIEERLGVRALTSLDAALSERPHAAIICNPTSLHIATAIAAVEADCHVLIEKPLSHSWQDVDRFITTASSRDCVAAVCYQLRFHPVVRRLRELLAREVLGDVMSVRAEWSEYLPDAHPYEDYRISYAARSELGGGVILCFIHELDYLIWLFGMPSEVLASGGRLSDLDVDVEDTATIVMRSTDGPTIEVRLCFGERARRRFCAVTGTDGRIEVDLMASTLNWFDAAGTLREHLSASTFQRNQLFVDVLTDFFGAIDERRAPVVSADDGSRSLRVALAAKNALRAGRPVSLAP